MKYVVSGILFSICGVYRMYCIRHKSTALLIAAATLFFGADCNCANQIPQHNPAENQYDIAAYVWPSCHHDERFGDMLWPEGEGEWEIIKKGNPRFEGHYQPKVPLWGYELDNDPKVMERWIDTATNYGVNVFIFDWYWYDGGPFLESCLNDGFLKAKNNEKMKFYIMWANHDVAKNYWNVHQYVDDKTQLWNGAVDKKNFEVIVDRVIKQYFSRPNYYKIDGKPVFSLFNVKEFINGLGGIQQAREAIEYFRRNTQKAGYAGLHFQQIVFGPPDSKMINKLETLSVDSLTMYNWGGPHYEDYLRWGAQSMRRMKDIDNAVSIPFFPNASIGWDDSPRFPKKTKKHIVHLNNSPKAFASFLQQAKDYCDLHPDQPKLITIFSWNEWIEGGYLLPDKKYGFSYLEAVEKVISGEHDQYRSFTRKLKAPEP